MGEEANNPNLICFCHGVSEQEIRKAIREGKAKTIKDIQDQLLASTGCGGCASEVERILAEELEKMRSGI